MDAIKTGALIAQARKEKELTQKDLAEALHVSTQAVSKWERGLNCPDVGLLEPLAEKLDLTVTELLSGQRGEEPGEEAVRDSLRFGENQLRPKIRRWKWLFITAAVLLLAVVLGFGYVWVRDNTQLIPQKETVFTPIELEEEQNALVDLLTFPNSWDYLRMYRAVLADDMDRVVFKAELYRDGMRDRELVQSWHLGTLYAREPGQPNSRRQLVTFRLTFLEGSEIQYKLRLGGSSVSGGRSLSEALPRPIVGMGYSASAGEPVTVDREEGAVLLRLNLGLEPEGEWESAPFDYNFLIKAYWE